jgi:hypothetical protein
MVPQPYVNGITDTVSHGIASSLTASQIGIAAGDTVSVSVVCPDRWLPGDIAVVTSRDGHTFAGQVAGIDVCTGQVAIELPGRPAARATPLPGLRGPGQRRRCSHGIIHDHRPPAQLAVPRPGHPATAPGNQGSHDHDRADSARGH